MNAHIKTYTLNNVEIQQNGIIRNSKGRFLARLEPDIAFEGEHIAGVAEENMTHQEIDLIKDTKKRTAMRHKEQEVESPYIWIAIPVLLISWILIRWIIG